MDHANDRSRQKLLPVFSTQDELEARMIQGLLGDAGIESVINAQVPPGLFPLKMGELAKQDILVLESQAKEAKRIIAERYGAGWKPAE